MRRALPLMTLGLPCVVSCAQDQVPGEESDADTDTDSDTDADTDSDTDADTDVFPVMAIGLDYRIGWDQNKGLLSGFCFPDDDDAGEDPECYSNLVIITLATQARFSLDSDDPDYDQQVDDETCAFGATLELEPGTFPAEGYDRDTHSGNGSTKTMWASWSGTIDIDEQYVLDNAPKSEPECLNLDPTWFPTGDPIAYLDGMRVGVGIGETTESLTYDDATWWKDQAPYRFAVYTAINHPDGKGGVTFVGYDWSYARLYNWDENFVLTDEDDDGYLDAQDVTIPVDLSGVVYSHSTWYEAFERDGEQILDMSLMKQE